jgi:hypothetical protein
MTTKRQIAANRRHAHLGGPKTEEGKAAVRLNARKHGIFAAALTDCDRAELKKVYAELAEWSQPVGPVEQILVEKLAHTYIRLQRCARAEAEYHLDTWDQQHLPPSALEDLAFYSNRRESGFDPDHFERTVRLFARYDATLTNQFIRLLHEIERLQRLRLGADVPPPIVAHMTVEGMEEAQ